MNNISDSFIENNNYIPYKYPFVLVIWGILFFTGGAYIFLVYAPPVIVYDPNIFIPIIFQKITIYALGIISLFALITLLIGAIFRIKRPQSLVFSDYCLKIPSSLFKSVEVAYSQFTRVEEKKDLWIKILILHTEKRSYVVARSGITMSKYNYDKAHLLLKNYLK